MAIIAGGDDRDDFVVAHDRLVVKEQRFRLEKAELQQPPVKALFPFPENGIASDKVALPGLHGKTEARFQHMVFIGDIVSEMPKALFDATGIERMQAAEFQVGSGACILDRLEYMSSLVG